MIVKKVFELVKENKAITREELASQVFFKPGLHGKSFQKKRPASGSVIIYRKCDYRRQNVF